MFIRILAMVLAESLSSAAGTLHTKESQMKSCGRGICSITFFELREDFRLSFTLQTERRDLREEIFFGLEK